MIRITNSLLCRLIGLVFFCVSCKSNDKSGMLSARDSVVSQRDVDTSDIIILNPDRKYIARFGQFEPVTISLEEINEIERLIQIYIHNFNRAQQQEFEEKNNALPDRYTLRKFYTINLSQYRKQFIPLLNKQRQKEVWVNAFTGVVNKSWRDRIKIGHDGTRCFFQMKINIADGKICDFKMNDQKLFYQNDKPWALVWSDDFSELSLDPNNWRALERGLNYNQEIQAYLQKNVSILNNAGEGELVLEAKKENWTGPVSIANLEDSVTRLFTSGEVRTLRTWTYGKFEVRAKAVGIRGYQSAIWMTAARETWPPEIDIMELLGKEPSNVYFTNHYSSQKDHQFDNGSFHGTDLTNNYHVYALEWEPNSIKWYVDGIKQYEVTDHVPNEPLYLRLSLSVGTEWAGQPDTTSNTPQTFRIDWVKVYQRED